ncbi:helix-turn-helix domain-containing protein [Rhizobium mongolense]|uniref:AraC-like DNA-binding protein/quercetin dioxygenase-like cupin family protein n=1 Tax=Rhizobium mongolense TaxID=57676 RepID=A0A7W6RUY4_9HYPH|nr:AraC family transcriptional regulator [Rhizobium mongolense]MBB4279043.1 AraC-like DNA-binding protein/quercetin dioxygenase-like cupin family protein [Rhizobium mongolense]
MEKRPVLEHLPAPSDGSWVMLNRRLEEGIPFQWHHHPEFELTLTLNSRGQRFVGDHVAAYDHGDLVLVGPNLPHTWSSRERIRSEQPHIALVFWFDQAWIHSLVDNTVEFRPIKCMLDRALTGLAFQPSLGRSLIDDFESVFTKAPSQRLFALLDILLRIASADQDQPLSSIVPQPDPTGRLRIDRVLYHLHQNYRHSISMQNLADIAALSLSGLHRMFKKHTRTTVSEYLISLRIGEACARLSGTDEPIRFIADEVGYSTLANFNRQFRSLRGMTPREYRNSFRS